MKKFLGWGSAIIAVGNLGLFIAALYGYQSTGITSAFNYLIIAMFMTSTAMEHLRVKR